MSSGENVNLFGEREPSDFYKFKIVRFENFEYITYIRDISRRRLCAQQGYLSSRKSRFRFHKRLSHFRDKMRMKIFLSKYGGYTMQILKYIISIVPNAKYSVA